MSIFNKRCCIIIITYCICRIIISIIICKCHCIRFVHNSILNCINQCTAIISKISIWRINIFMRIIISNTFIQVSYNNYTRTTRTRNSIRCSCCSSSPPTTASSSSTTISCCRSSISL